VVSFKHLKWAIAVLTLLVLLAVPPVVHGGPRWRGVDPILTVGGHQVNVWVEWPEPYTCLIDKTITFKISAPEGVLVSESSGSFGCDDGTTNDITTRTRVSQKGVEGTLSVSTKLRAPADFPVRVLVYVDGKLQRTCEGSANRVFTCDGVNVN